MAQPQPRPAPDVKCDVADTQKKHDDAPPSDISDKPFSERLCEVASAFLPMGFIAFGGPQAHIALFMKTFVQSKKWLDEQRFMELMSLGQAMPGPTSTQMATAMGISRAGVLGGMISFWLFDWVGFIIQLGVGTAIHHFGRSATSEALYTYKMIMLGMGPAAISQVYLSLDRSDRTQARSLRDASPHFVAMRMAVRPTRSVARRSASIVSRWSSR